MTRLDAYERPSVAADAVVFGIDADAAAPHKGLIQRRLKLLLVRRGEEPFAGAYGLPGGFLRKGETIEQTALRELAEESGVSEPKILHLGVYSAPDRDPRGWVITCAFLALTRTVALSTAAGSDAAEAEWFDFEFAAEPDGCEQITLSDAEQTLHLRYQNGSLLQNALAFDHGQIIYDAFRQLRDEVMYHDLIFDLMPPLFAVSDLQQPYEIITGTHTSPQNFRKKMASRITETEFYNEAAAHRTAKLYRRKEGTA